MCAYNHSLAYAVVTFRKVRRKSEPRMRMVSCVCSCLQEGPIEIQTPTRLNLIGRRMIAPPTVLSPSSILPHLRRLRFYSRKENFGAFIQCRLAYRINLVHLVDRKSPGGNKMTFVR